MLLLRCRWALQQVIKRLKRKQEIPVHSFSCCICKSFHCPAADWLTFAQHKPAYRDTADIFPIISVTLRINIITLMSFCSDEGLCAETSTLISLCCFIRLFYLPAVNLFLVVLLCSFLWSLSIFLKLYFFIVLCAQTCKRWPNTDYEHSLCLCHSVWYHCVFPDSHFSLFAFLVSILLHLCVFLKFCTFAVVIFSFFLYIFDPFESNWCHFIALL